MHSTLPSVLNWPTTYNTDTGLPSYRNAFSHHIVEAAPEAPVNAQQQNKSWF